MYPHFEAPVGAVIPFPFATYDSNGASVTLTGLAVTDIEVYKLGSGVTQRASDAGYALIDTDGIDIDGITGIHGFTIDTSDNTDAGFYAAGSIYHVVVSAVTVDSQTVNFIAGSFRLKAAEASAGLPSVNSTHIGGTSQTGRDIGASVLLSSGTGTGQVNLSSGRVDANTTYIAGSAVSTSSAQLGVNVVNAGGTAWGSGAITAASIATDAITAAKIAADAIGASELAADAVTEIANAIAAIVVESNDSITLQQAASIILAAVAGVTASGGVVLKDPSGTDTRITATVNGSNERTAIVLTPSS